MFLPDCWLQLHNNKPLVLEQERSNALVLEQERSNASVDTSNMPLVVYFTSHFDNRRAGVWLIKLTDWIVQRICSSGCDFGCILPIILSHILCYLIW